MSLYPEGFTTNPPRRSLGAVLYAPGALYGYCPKCGAPGERRTYEGDRCQQWHKYPSNEATERPMK